MMLRVAVLLMLAASFSLADVAEDLILRGRLGEAYQHLLEIYGNLPDQPEYFFVKGYSEGAGEVSAAYLKDFLNRSSRESELVNWARLLLGKYYLAQKLYVSGRKHFESIPSGSVFSEQADLLAARCYLLAEEFGSAVQNYQAAADQYQAARKPESDNFQRWVVLGLADAQLAKGDLGEAERLYKRLTGSEFKHDVGAPALLALIEITKQRQAWDDFRRYTQMYQDAYGEISRATTERPQAPASPPAKAPTQEMRSSSRGRYYVQIGTYSKQDDAGRVSLIYRNSGYETVIETFTERGREFHRVLVGGYESKQQAEFVKRRLEKATGENYAVVAR